MPIYLYEREDGTTFEKLQKVSEDPLTECPSTGQKVKRKIAPTAIHFKGSGFYETDYKSNGKSASSEGDSSSSSSKDTSGSKGSDSAACNGKGPSGGCQSCGPTTSSSSSSTDS